MTNDVILVESHGFTLLGDITLDRKGRLKFPTPPKGGGLYYIQINAGGAYLGEGKSYGPGESVKGTKATTGRFKNYESPAYDVWTELVVNAMLKAGAGGRVYLLPVTTTAARRKKLESVLIKTFRESGVMLWNAGVGRDEKKYWSYKMPIFERTYADVVVRYALRDALTPHATKRLRDLHRWAPKYRAIAAELDIDIHDEHRVDQKIFNVRNTSSSPPLRLNARPKTVSTKTTQSMVHQYMAKNRGASKTEVIIAIAPDAHPGDKIVKTINTFYDDFVMTMEAIQDQAYSPGERVTLTTRRVACRLWIANKGVIDARLVDTTLRNEGHERTYSSIQQITNVTKSIMTALKRA